SMVATIRGWLLVGDGWIARLVRIGGLLRMLSTLAAISIVMDVTTTGDVDAKKILMGILFGAAAGSRFGPVGALAGGLIIPITMAFKQKSPYDQIADQLDARAKKWMQTANMAGGNKELKDYNMLLAQHNQYLANAYRGYQGSDEALEHYQKTLMNLDQFAKFQQTTKALDQLEANRTEVHNKMAKENVETTKKEVTERINAWKKFNADMRKYNTAMTDFQDKQTQFKKDLQNWNDQLKDATAQAGQDAITNLRNMYSQMEEDNRAAFGEIFKGPWLTSESFDIAKEWGVVPRIQDLIKDLTQQNNQFAQWRSNLDKLFKKGLPAGLIDDIKKMGIEEGSPIMENILKANPAQVSKLIAQYKRREAQIKSSTKMDFSDEIERFRKAGGNMGAAIIDGFESAQVGMFFDRWIKTKFPNAISSAVNEAVSRWKAGNPPPVAPARPVRPTAPKLDRTRPAGGTAQNPGGSATMMDKGWTPKQTIAAAAAAAKGDTYNFHFQVGGQDVIANDAAIRHAAFIAKNAFRGAFK